jgi:hypothetical protein
MGPSVANLHIPVSDFAGIYSMRDLANMPTPPIPPTTEG